MKTTPQWLTKRLDIWVKKDLGLGLLRIDRFWKAIKMSWLRRLTSSKSTWALLHRAETKPYTFSQMTSNWSKIEMARSKMDNLVWKEIYGALLACRKNLVKASPPEYLFLPVNGEPYITKNNIAIQQPWCENLMINDILDFNGRFKKLRIIPLKRDQFSMKTLQ